MDARTLRAALSAAVRVTVSTSLIGCGGNVSRDATGAPSAQGGSAPTTTAPTPVEPADDEQHADGHGGVVGTAGSGVVSTSDGGAPASTDGGMGGGAGAGSGPIDRCAAVEACLTLLEDEKLDGGQPLTDRARACCNVVTEELRVVDEAGMTLPKSSCGDAIPARFSLSPARLQCCSEAGWPPLVSLACTPWGPPVPPELPVEVLEAWERAA